MSVVCDLSNIQSLIVREMIPSDESDEHSAVLELRAGTHYVLFKHSLSQ